MLQCLSEMAFKNFEQQLAYSLGQSMWMRPLGILPILTSKEDFEFYNEVAEKYPESKIVYESPSGYARLKFLGELLSSLHGSLLDVGCNNYIYERFWSGDYVGIDIAHILLFEGNRNGVWADIYSLPFRNNCFNYVLFSETLEHLWHRVEALCEVRRVLKNNGDVLCTVPTNPNGEIFAVTWMPELDKYGVKHYDYLHGFIPLEYMKQLAHESGFEIVETKDIYFDEPTSFFRLRKV